MCPSHAANTARRARARRHMVAEGRPRHSLPTRAVAERQPGCSAPRAGDLFWQFGFGRRICSRPSKAWSPGTRQLSGQAPGFSCARGPGDVHPRGTELPTHRCHLPSSRGREVACFAFGNGGWRNERNTTFAGLQISKRMQEKTLLNLSFFSPPPTPPPEQTFNTKPQLKLIRSQFRCQRFISSLSAASPKQESAHRKLSQNLFHRPLRCSERSEKDAPGDEAPPVPPPQAQSHLQTGSARGALLTGGECCVVEGASQQGPTSLNAPPGYTNSCVSPHTKAVLHLYGETCVAREVVHPQNTGKG